MLNKKVLAAAIVGSLFAAGNAAAVDFTAGNAAAVAATAAEFAKEIKTTTGANATTFSGAGLDITWASGYAYSPNEVRYVRIEAPAHVVFQTGAVGTAGGTGGLDVGAINGLGTNVITFSVTGDAATGGGADVELTLTATAKVSAIADADVKVSLYDLPSQAQAGGSNGLIQGGSYAGKYFTFIDSLEWDGTANTLVADVEAQPSFTLFDSGDEFGTVNNDLELVATGALAADSTPLGVGDIIDVADSTVTISGDFSFVASAGATPFNTAALARVEAFGGNPDAGDLTANSATFALTSLVGDFYVEKLVTPTWNPAIPATTFTAKLNAVSADSSTYRVPTLADADIGAIVRNGTELQAPLAQIPNAWISRLVLTNTSGVARPYTISVMTEADVDVTEGTLTGTIPANGTKVIDDLKTVFSGNNRATLVVNVAGPNDAIQGLYQIVNPTTGSISNHVLVRPGSN